MRRLCLWLAAVAVVSLLAPAGRAAGGQFALTDTDRVLFFGSTATWPASFGMQVEAFVRVKYPQLKTRFWHWGPSLPAPLARMKVRIGDYLAPFKPTVVVLNCGLDDGKKEPLVESRLSAFRANLIAVIDQCQKAGAKVILVTPNCPEKDRKTALIKADYDDVVDRYAQVMRDLGSERKLMVIDWYTATRERVVPGTEAKDQEKALTTDGLHATPLAHAVATDLLLEALGAEPHEVTVHVDWASLEASTTAGGVSATRTNDSAITVELVDFPMPWLLPGSRQTLRPDRPASRFCRFLFHLGHAPPGGVLVCEPGGKPTPWPGQMLEDGCDLTSIGPLVNAQPVKDLLNLIRDRKNRRLDAYERFLLKPFTEPEYAEVNARYREAIVAELMAAARVIDRTPRTLDLTLEIKLAKPPTQR